MKEEQIKKKNREELLKLLKEVSDKKIFSNVKNPVEWQRKQRDEWKKNTFR